MTSLCKWSIVHTWTVSIEFLEHTWAAEGSDPWVASKIHSSAAVTGNDKSNCAGAGIETVCVPACGASISDIPSSGRDNSLSQLMSMQHRYHDLPQCYACVEGLMAYYTNLDTFT